jgi:hypothetical protein
VQTPAQKLPVRLIKDSVWEGIGEDEELVRTMTDTDTFGRLEKLFGAADKPIVKNKEEEKKGPKIVALLDAKRSSSIEIMLARIRISFVDTKVGGRFSTFYAGRFDWDLPICSACSGHEITEWKRPGQDAPSLGRGFRSALPPAPDRHALRGSPLTALDVSEVRTLPFIHISP